MAVTYQTEGVKMPEIKKRETTEWIKAVAASYGKRLGEIAYIFCSDEKILEVNRQICNTTIIRILSLLTIVRVTVCPAICSLAWIRYAPMQSNSVHPMMMNCTASLFMGYSIFAV